MPHTTNLFLLPSENQEQQDFLSGRRLVFVMCAVFALYLLTYLAMWPQAPILAGDSKGYMAMARDLSGGLPHQSTIRTPGYPLWLLWLGSAYTPTKSLFVAGLLTHFLVVCMLMSILRHFNLPTMIVLISAVLLLLPPYVQSAALVMTENLTEFALMSAAWLLFWALKQNHWFSSGIAGVAIAAAALVRPTYQFLWVAFALSVCLASLLSGAGKRQVKSNLAMLGITLLLVLAMLGAYSGYNQKRFGFFGLTYALGVNLCDKTALFVDALPESYEPLRSSLIRQRDASLLHGKSHTAEQYPWDHWEELKTDLNQNDLALAKKLARANAELIARNPLSYLLSVAKAAVSLLFPYVTRAVGGQSAMAQAAWSGLHFVVIGVFLVQLILVFGVELWTQSLRGIGAAAERCETAYLWRLAYLLSLAIVAYTIVVSALTDSGNPRYRSPTDPLLVMNAALGIGLWWQRMRAIRTNCGENSKILAQPTVNKTKR